MKTKWVKSVNIDYSSFIKKAWGLRKKFRNKESKTFETKWIKKPYQIVASLLCIQHKEPDSLHFKLEWTPLYYYVTLLGIKFNWTTILSSNMADVIMTT